MVLLKERIQLNKPPEQIPLSKIRVPIPILPMKERHVEGTTPWRSIFPLRIEWEGWRKLFWIHGS